MYMCVCIYIYIHMYTDDPRREPAQTKHMIAHNSTTSRCSLCYVMLCYNMLCYLMS